MKRQFYLLAFSLALGLASNVLGDSPSFTTIDFPNAASTQAWGISPRGDIVGFYVNSDKTSHGFLLSGGHYTSIDFPGAMVTLVNGINPSGDIVGEYGVTLTSPHHGFLLSSNGVFTSIDYPGATTYSSAIGITPGGDIVGIYNFADNVSHGFLLSEARFTSIDYPGAASTTPNGISTQGEVVGGYLTGGANHGFALSNGNFTSFDFPNSNLTIATGANASGDIVGRYRDAAAVNHGFLMSGGKFTSIEFPGASFTGATAIDPSGNIVGRYTLGGVTHGYLLSTPPSAGRYTITDLGDVGVSPGQPFYVTDNKLVSGAVGAADGTMHGVLWRQGMQVDLGTTGLGGKNSVAFGNSEKGLAVGQAETSIPESNGEDFCGFQALGLPTSGTTCVPFVWQFGVMTELPTLGGHNGAANLINSRGQAVGMVENNTLDPACPAPQKYQFKPVIWENGEARELPTAAGDPNGYAFAINQNGDVSGASGVCAAFNQESLIYLQPLHALLWQTGKVIDLGNLGGTGMLNGVAATGLNNMGQVVGNSDMPGDTTFHAFLWSQVTRIQDLGTLPGDFASTAVAINDSGEVVGISADADFNPRAVLWRNGVIADLNDLVSGDSPLYLLTACSINSHGDIIGLAATSDGEVHGFMATPTTGATAHGVSPTLSASARKLLKKRLPAGRFGTGRIGPQ